MRLDTALACALPHAPSTPATTPATADRLIAAGTALFNSLGRGKKLEAADLRHAMTAAFDGNDQQGVWLWKDAYEAVEIAQILFLRQYLPTMRAKAASPAALLGMLSRIAALTPTHTRRSEESETFQQFSTPIELGFIAATAARITAADHVLEPSAGTGMLAIFADTVGATLTLNEIAETRYALLGKLFPDAFLARCNAEQIDDYLPADRRPIVILMNPPFSAALHVRGRDSDTTFRHLRSALQRLAPGGRLVAITGASCSPDDAARRPAWQELLQWGTVPFSAPISGKLYQRHGTTTATRLTVIDRLLPGQIAAITPSYPEAPTAPALLELIVRHVPPRADADPDPTPPRARPVALAVPSRSARPSALVRPALAPSAAVDVEPILYRPRENAGAPQEAQADQLYALYRLQSIVIDGAQPHPTPLVQSAAMASVNSPLPTYRPLLPQPLITGGILSEAQLESVIYAGEAHTHYLTGQWSVNESADILTPAPEDDPKALRYRKGWFLGDGTGAGKGRQIAGIILDNWLQGRHRAVWISKSDKLIEDAQRDWSALGQEKLLIVPQDRYRQGTSIRLAEGILFSTYATLRSAERQNKASRIDQLIEWLGPEFDGVVIFDEAHAMANAAGEKGTRGPKGPSQQGLAGLRLQHRLPHARIVYVSATGATTVTNLAYAQRLGLWGTSEFPFAKREEFVTAMEASGIASMEVLARDLKALGLYAARALSYEGIEVELLEHAITDQQERIYNAYAGAFQIIHQNLTEALEAANITSAGGTLNRNAKAAARSAFEGNKQRFFNHLITAMKTPTLLRAIEGDQREGRASVIQLVSTSEALMERRLAQIPAAEWGDLNVDITPREYVLDYLASGFPTQLYERYSDEDGNILSRPVIVDGQPVECREAVARRDALIEHLAALPPVQSALDQILHHFGADAVAEVTGRNRRIVKHTDASGARLKVENRPGSANLAETHAFMDGGKNILVFSDAGGTGRSYHADKNARNQRRRAHYLLEAGWRADAAIQGLGRSNRTNQAQPPLFRPIATTIRGEKRFLSTIARRLDTLGAITRGQRQTGGQGMFRAEDNLESPYARSALTKFYLGIYRGKIAECSLERFQEITALRLCDNEGGLLDELPPITTFLNRLLALEIPMQNTLFGHFEDLLAGEVEGAIAAGIYEVGLETIRAESLLIAGRQTLTTHPATGGITEMLTFTRLDRNTPMPLPDALLLADQPAARVLRNAKSGRCAVALPAPSLTHDDGTVEAHLRLIRPMNRSSMAADLLADSFWDDVDNETFAQGWMDELAQIPEFSSSTFHLVTGLLLPIWNRLPRREIRVYRLTTDAGERIIGRVIPEREVGSFLSSFGLSGQAQLTPDAAWRALHDGGTLTLADGLAVKRASVMHQRRIEVTGFTPEALPLLKAKGCFAEIIQWRTRLFIPDSSAGEAILTSLLAEHPLQVLSSGQ